MFRQKNYIKIGVRQAVNAYNIFLREFHKIDTHLAGETDELNSYIKI